MRKIKFRAKASLYNDWVYGSYCATKSNTFIIDENGKLFPIYKDTIGQYTGLKDKNGIEIYEGDILLIGEQRWKVEVIFKDGSFGFMYNETCVSFQNQSPEVIGNIYDKETN